LCGLTVDIKVVSKEPALLYLCILTITNLSVAISSSSELDNRNRMCVKNIQRGRGIKLHFWHLSPTFSDSNNSGSGSGSGSSDSDSGSQSGSGSSGSSSQSENGNDEDGGQPQTENLSDSQDGFGRVTKTAIIKDVAKVGGFVVSTLLSKPHVLIL